jgi:hypothetical protein
MTGVGLLLVPAVLGLLGIGFSFVEHLSNLLGYSSLFEYRTWIKVHLQSQLLFALVVYGGSVCEALSFPFGHYPTMLSYVPLLDNVLCLPTLATCCLSGVALTKIKYTSKGKEVPWNFNWTMRILFG